MQKPVRADGDTGPASVSVIGRRHARPPAATVPATSRTFALPSALVLQAAGVNCDRETARALELAGASPEFVHVNRLVEQPAELDRFDLLVLPGGFSYGDDVAAGRILGDRLHRTLGDRLRSFAGSGRPIAGICNGFQVLLNVGLLDATPGRRDAALTANGPTGTGFVCRWVTLNKVADAAWTQQWAADEAVELPVAHAEGRVLFRDEDARQAAAERVVARYVETPGAPTDLPAIPNESTDGIAGLCDATGRIVGLMPHPERYVEPLQHPAAARRRLTSSDDAEPAGLRFFQAGVAAAR